MIKKILSVCLIFFGTQIGLASASQTDSFGKGAQSAQISWFHPVSSLCTKVSHLVNAAALVPAIQFNSVSTDGCKVTMTGAVPASSGSSYNLSLRLQYATATETSKVVELGVRAYAVVPWNDAGAGPERVTNTTQVTLSSGTSRNFVQDQFQYIEGTITVKKPNGSACDSACNNAELVLYIEPTAGMTIPGNDFYLVGYEAYWTH